MSGSGRAAERDPGVTAVDFTRSYFEQENSGQDSEKEEQGEGELLDKIFETVGKTGGSASFNMKIS